jgi:hypothetical protein
VEKVELAEKVELVEKAELVEKVRVPHPQLFGGCGS